MSYPPRPWTLDRLRARCVVNERGCWIWQGALKDGGYGHIARSRVWISTHRLSYELSHGDIPDGMYVLHRCDVRRCCNPDHLFLGTAKDNTRDMLQKGRNGYTGLPGERSPHAKLTEPLVREIRQSDEFAHVLALRYGVSKTLIRKVRTRESWRHVA